MKNKAILILLLSAVHLEAPASVMSNGGRGGNGFIIEPLSETNLGEGQIQYLSYCDGEKVVKAIGKDRYAYDVDCAAAGMVCRLSQYRGFTDIVLVSAFCAAQSVQQ